jgi:hypothetical protein
MINSNTFDTASNTIRTYATAANRDKAVAKMIAHMQRSEQVDGLVKVLPYETNGRYTAMIQLDDDCRILMHDVLDAGFIVLC